MTAQQPAHLSNVGVKAVPFGLPSDIQNVTPSVQVAGSDAPVKVIDGEQLNALGLKLRSLFDQYRFDRRILELRWLRNQRQYLGIYDPEVEQEMSPNRSKAYPKITRVKCITVLSKLMNLMFPGNERNWELQAAPDPSVTQDEVREAIAAAQARDQATGVDPQPVTMQYAMDAIHELMVQRAEKLSVVIDDQLQELGGDQTYDYVALNRQVLRSGINYGLGLLRGPFARKAQSVEWEMQDDEQNPGQQLPMPSVKTVYKPLYEFVPIWDFYPDLSAKCLHAMGGYFLRKVLDKSQLIALKKRKDFFGDQIARHLSMFPTGNYKQLEFEWELRAMGVKSTVNEQKPDTQKYEVMVWLGKIDGYTLEQCGVEVAEDKITDQLDAEIWFIEGTVIKCALNPWAKLEVDVRTLHHFLYDEDDTSPVGFGLPNAMRDSQMMVSAATRMLLDNASIVCGPNLELNMDLLRADQDVSAIRAYRIWYRGGDSNADPVTAAAPAVRNISVDPHMKELMEVIKLGMEFADAETFVGPSNGADQSQMPSEPFRTASGASMLRGEAALPFKDMVRAFDSFTQSVIQSIIAFNKVFNPNKVHTGDYNVIARGATSLIAKEVRGMQADQLATTLSPEEKREVDARKLLKVRLKSRDMDDIMVSDSESQRRSQADQQDQEEKEQQMQEMAQAQLRKLLSDAYKNIAGGQKNIAAADAQAVETLLETLERGVALHGAGQSTDPQAGNNGAGQDPLSSQGAQPGGPDDPQALGPQG